MDKPTLLLVDDEVNNIKLLSQVLKDKYIIRVAMNGKEALERASIEPLPDLILLDVIMPEMDGFEVCRKLKADTLTTKIPVIFVTAKNEIEDETMGFDVGGIDYIIKPISSPIVQARVATHISLSDQQKSCELTIMHRTSELMKTQEAAVYMLGEAGHYNDNDTGVHIWRMASYARALARAVNWPVEKAAMLELAATMHDTGKIGIPDSILKAPRKLTADEWVIMKRHTEIGYSILSKSDAVLFCMAAEIALAHHERWDGSGYPKQLAGTQIPESARIVAIADVFDALTMERPYKEPWSIDDALNEIEKGKGTHFEPYLVDIFMSIESEIRNINKEYENKDEKHIKLF